MEKKKRFYYAGGGFLLGALLVSLVWLCAGGRTEARVGAGAQETEVSMAGAAPEEALQDGLNGYATQDVPVSMEKALQSGSDECAAQAVSAEEEFAQMVCGDGVSETYAAPGVGEEDAMQLPQDGSADVQEYDDSLLAAAKDYDAWDRDAVYTGGDIVRYKGQLYRAKWWTQGEQPDKSDVWEGLGTTDAGKQPEGVKNVPVDATVPKDTELTDFKVVGYFPSWKPDKLSSVDFNVVTHVCYAFAIPTADGGLRGLDNPKTAKALIRSAHKSGAKVLLSVGGWEYNGTPLEAVFMEATATKAKRKRLANKIVAMCDKYGFDGVDMDWEHPRMDGGSAKRYEDLMLLLSKKLHAKDKLLTAAVLSGATADGNIYYDAAAHTNAVLNAVDFINVMAYDGGDGERHSSYKFAVNCAKYWKKTRGLPSHKVVLGVPFYARPSWADYGTILAAVPGADKKDHVTYNGMEAYYNGVSTITKKARYAKKNLGGIMIWELTQDTANKKKSLLQAIGKVAKKN